MEICDREAILRKAAKLTALANDNPSLEEAESASNMLGKILRQHNLSMVDMAEAQFTDSIIESEAHTPWSEPFKWEWELANGIADACSCEAYGRALLGKDGYSFFFVGEDISSRLAQYWFSAMHNLLLRLGDQYAAMQRETMRLFGLSVTPSKRRQLQDAYLFGAAEAIGGRLQSKIKPGDSETKPASDNALMVSHAIGNWMTVHHPGIKKTGMRAPNQWEARADGSRAAEDVSLSDGVEHAPHVETKRLEDKGNDHE